MKNFLNISCAVCWLVLGLLAQGCRTVDSTAAGKFATSVTAVKTQTDDALNAVAELSRESSITFAASQSNLTEANFVQTPTGDMISDWDGAFTAMETYAQNLTALLSSGAAKDFDVAATNLFNQFNQAAVRLNANGMESGGTGALLAMAFTETADAIIRARQQATAIRIAQSTDTNITRICTLFANEIGADRVSSPCLRKTLYKAVWAPRLAALTAPFLSANPEEKVTICKKYADLLARRDAQDQILAGLRRSILLLADAHHALAQGKPASIQADLTVISNEIDHTRALFNRFSSSATK